MKLMAPAIWKNFKRCLRKAKPYVGPNGCCTIPFKPNWIASLIPSYPVSFEAKAARNRGPSWDWVEGLGFSPGVRRSSIVVV